MAPRHFVGQLSFAQCFFKNTRLVIGAVQDGKVFELTVRGTGGICACPQRLNACHSTFCFVFFVVGIHHAHGLALAQFGEQGFGKQLGVGLNHIVGGSQNCAGGAVVLFQLDHLQRWKVLRQFAQVIQRGASPAIDRLVVVAHRCEARFVAHKALQHFVLGGVGVLVFIDQHMAELCLPFEADFFVFLQQLQWHANQVVKVHALIGGQSLFVTRHDFGDGAFVVIFGDGHGLG